jgi:hypothetical protein
LHPTPSHEDSEENGKGINAVLNERLNGYDNGFGLISYRVGFGAIGSDLDPLCGARPRVRWAVAPTDWATQAVRVRRGRLGRAVDSAQKPIFNNKSFSFSNLFYKLSINLNSNQI